MGNSEVEVVGIRNSRYPHCVLLQTVLDPGANQGDPPLGTATYSMHPPVLNTKIAVAEFVYLRHVII